MQNLSTVIFKFLFCCFLWHGSVHRIPASVRPRDSPNVHRVIGAVPFVCEQLVKQNAPDFSEAFYHSERGIRTLDTAGMNRML